MRISTPVRNAAPLLAAGLLAASCAQGHNQSPNPTESASPKLGCPVFEDNSNPNALPHSTGLDVRVAGVAATVMGNFEAACKPVNKGAGLDVTANAVGGVTLRYIVGARGGSYTEQLVLTSSTVAGYGSVSGFEITDNVTVSTSDGGSSQETKTRIDASVDDGAWSVESVLPDGSDLTYSTHGDQTNRQGAAGAMGVADQLLKNMYANPPAPANAAPYGA